MNDSGIWHAEEERTKFGILFGTILIAGRAHDPVDLRNNGEVVNEIDFDLSEITEPFGCSEGESV